jgi:hypothetical protein
VHGGGHYIIYKPTVTGMAMIENFELKPGKCKAYGICTVMNSSHQQRKKHMLIRVNVTILMDRNITQMKQKNWNVRVYA